MKKIFTFLLFTSICLFKPNFLNAQVNVQDSLALVALYDNTDGPNWRQNINWLTSMPVSTWYGITVTDNRVTSIKLNNNELNGHIPGKLGNLTNLVVLNLAVNHRLRNRIPSELGNLINLRTLDLTLNHLSGKIPYSFGRLINLDTLILRWNQLSDRIPVSLNNMKGLKMLDSFEPFKRKNSIIHRQSYKSY